MNCPLCASSHEAEFSTEIAIHFDGLKNLDTPHVFISRKGFSVLGLRFLTVCGARNRVAGIKGRADII
jgi:hypothetical protein